MMYRFFLDGNLISHPQDWDKFSTKINRDVKTSSITLTQSYDLTFNSNEYNYFKNKLITNGYCDQSEIVIEYSVDDGNTWLLFHNGIIYLSDLRFNRKTKEVNARVQDNSYYAYINNNKDLGVYPYTTTTKNGDAITPISIKAIHLFDPSTGVDLPFVIVNGYEYACYKAYDMFKFIISYITDNKVDFKSDCFGAGGEFENTILTTGYVIRYSNFNAPAGVNYEQFKKSWKQISFNKLFSEMNKRFNLFYWVEYIAGTPTLRIEKALSSYSNTIIPLSNQLVDDVDVTINSELLYSEIILGSNVTDSAAFLSMAQLTPLLRFTEEKITIQGQCNLNNSFNLKTDFVHDSNVIEDLSINGWASSYSQNYDEDVFVIDSSLIAGNVYSAKRTNWLSATTPPVFYNEKFTNYNILFRFFPFINLIFPTSNDNVIAYRPAGTIPALSTLSFSQVRFPDDSVKGFDPNNNFGNGTSGTNITTANSIFTAPVNDSYLVNFEFERIDFCSGGTLPFIKLSKYDLANTFIADYSIDIISNQYPLGANYNLVFSFPAISMNAGDYLKCEISNGLCPLLIFQVRDDIGFIKWNITSATSMNSNDQIYINNRTDNIYKSEFTLPMNIDDVIQITNNLPALIEYKRENDSSVSNGWIQSLNYSYKDNQAKIVLISNKSNTEI